MYTGNKQIDSFLKKMENFFQGYLHDKAPALPEKMKKIITQYGPWLLVVFLIIGFFALFAGFGITITSIAALLMRNIGQALIIILLNAIMIVVFVLEALAVPGLLKMKKKSWYLVYYATLLGFVQSLLVANIVMGVVFTLLSLYILFQIKSFYKN